MYVALRPDRLATISELAASDGISRNHIMKIVYELGLAGYIETVRGQNGGMRLAKPLRDIGLGEVIRFAEPDIAFVPCFEPRKARLRDNLGLQAETSSAARPRRLFERPGRIHPH
jgi:Rrf2 family nitric oxide-sensitive transcriptional repressor